MLDFREGVSCHIGGAGRPQCGNLHQNHNDSISDKMPRPEGDLWKNWDCIVCIDSEYQNDGNGTNSIISWQTAVLVREGDGWDYFELYQDCENRPTFAQVIGTALDVCLWPKNSTCRMLLVAHNTVAEWSMLADREKWLEGLEVIGNTLVSKPKSDISVAAVRRHNHQTMATVCLRDTMLLTPGRGGLAKATAITPFPKIHIDDDTKKAMRQFRKTHPVDFRNYALQDVRGGLAYIVLLGNKVEMLTGKPKLPLTLGAMATQGFTTWLQGLDGYGIDLYHGTEKRLVTDKYNRSKIIPVKSMPRALTDTLAASCFHGGRNYAAHAGKDKCPLGHFVLDLDLGSAYVAAMAVMPLVDWTVAPKRVEDIDLAIKQLKRWDTPLLPIGLGEVEFVFPTDVEPCLPVASGVGLLYPLKGISYCTGIELVLAAERGAKLILKNFYVWNQKLKGDFRQIPAMADYLSILAGERQKYPKESLENLFYKEMGNSLYGKLAQGVTERTILNLAGERKQLPPSQVTNVLYAAMVTGVVRAVLQCLEEGLKKHGGRLLAATTDGAMAVMPCAADPGAVRDIEQLVPGLLTALNEAGPVRVIRQGRLNLGLMAEDWIELKHWGDEYLVFKTRGYALRYQGGVTFLARAGHKLEGEKNDIWNDLVLLCEEETPSKLGFGSLPSVHDIISGKALDLVNVNQIRTANADWDWKRDLSHDGSTQPFDDIGQILQHRIAAQTVRARGQRATREAVKMNLQGVKLQGGTEKTMRRAILRAIVHESGGWGKPKKYTYQQLADALGVTLDDVKNAKRYAFRPHCLPASEVLEVIMKSMAKAIRKHLTDEMRGTLQIPGSGS